MRRAGRIALKVLAIGIAVAAVAIAALLAFLHTDRGRRELRDRVEAALDDAVTGDVRIGRVTGSVLGTIVAHDVVIDDAEGHEAIRIDRLSIDLALAPLVWRRARFRTVTADGVTVVVRRLDDGTWNVAGLVAPGDDEPLAWTVELGDLRLRDARVVIEDRGERAHLDDVVADGAITVRPDGRVDARGELRGRWRERDVPVRASGTVAVRGGAIAIPEAEVTAGAVRVTARDARVAGGAIRGDVRLDAPADALAELVPDLPIPGAFHLELSARPGAIEGSTLVTIGGTAGPTRVDGEVTVSPHPDRPRLRGALRLEDLDLARVIDGAIETSLDATVAFDLVVDRARDGLDALRGVVEVDAAGAIARVPVRELAARAVLDRGEVAAGASLEGAGGLDARIDGFARVAAGAVAIERARIVARADRLDLALGPHADARGRVEVALGASGRLGAGPARLAVAGRVTGDGLRAGEVAIARLAVTVDAAGLPDAATGTLRAEARGVRHGGRELFRRLELDARSRARGVVAFELASEPPWRPWRIDLEGVARLERGAATIELGAHRVRTAGVPWAGAGGVIRIDGERIDAERIPTTIAGGRAVASGTYWHRGPREGDVRAAVEAAALDLRELDRAFDLGGVWRGRVDGDLAVARRGAAWSGEVDGAVRGLVLRPGAPAIDVAGRATAAPGDVRAEVTMRGPEVGAVTVAADVAAPRRLDDVGAWRRLPRRAIRSARVTLAAVELGALARAAGRPAPVTGAVDGDLRLAAAEATGWLQARGLVTPALDAPIDADVRLVAADGARAAVTVDATARGLATATARVEVAPPARPFDPAAWAALDADAVHGAAIAIDGLSLAAVPLHRVGLPPGLEGRVRVTADVAAGLASAEARVEVAGLRGGPLVRPADLEVLAEVGAARVEARLRGAIGGATVVDATGAIDLDLAAALERGAGAVTNAPVEATITIPEAPLPALLAAVGRDGLEVGTVRGEIAIAGTVAAPTAEGVLVLAEVGATAPTLRELRVEGAWDGTLARADAVGRQRDGGFLRIRAAVRPDDLGTADLSVHAARFDLAPLAALAPGDLDGIAGTIDAALVVRGLDPGTARVAGVLRGRGLDVPLSPELGTLRRATAELRAAPGGGVVIAVDGRVGAGRLRIGAEGSIDGLLPRRLDGTVRVDGVTLLAERLPRITAEAELRVRHEGGQWVLGLWVDGGAVTIAGDGAELHPPGVPEDMVFVVDGRPPPAAADAARGPQLGVRPSAPPLRINLGVRRLAIEAPELRGLARADLVAQVGRDGIAIDGRVEVTEGFVEVFDRRYRIDRAAVVLDGGIDPRLDVLVFHELPELTLFVGLSGRLSAPALELRSEPATYSEGELLAFLIGAGPGAAPGAELRDTAAGLAATLLTDRIGDLLLARLPLDLDVLRYEAATAERGAALTVGRWFTRRLFVAYRRRLDTRPDDNAGEAEVEYWLGRNVLLEGLVGDRGRHGLDLVWIRRW